MADEPILRINNQSTNNDVNAFLPQQREEDWFQSIEFMNNINSHSINIYRPIGDDNYKQGPIYDIRGLDKYVTSWNQRRIYDIRGLDKSDEVAPQNQAHIDGHDDMHADMDKQTDKSLKRLRTWEFTN